MQEELQHRSYSSALKCGGYCEECQLDMQALEKCGPGKVFTKYHEKDITRIKSHVYGEKR